MGELIYSYDALIARQRDVFFMPEDFAVVVERDACLPEEAREFIAINTRHDWAFDWTWGDGRSDPPETRKQARYLFSDEEDAARFRLRFG